MRAILPVYGEAKKWAELCRKSANLMSPNLAIIEHNIDVAAVMQNLVSRPNMGISASVKSTLYREYGSDSNPILIVDADALFLKEFDWKPENPETVIAMAPGGDPKYLNSLMECGLIELPEDLVTVFNAGVIWLRTDLTELWNKYYPVLVKNVDNLLAPIGEIVFNAFWYHFHREGKAEIMPQKYNQLYGQHGIDGADILHLAGMHPRFKTQLMENLCTFFFEKRWDTAPE